MATPHLTQRLNVGFEVAQGYVAGNVDTQDGWAIMAGGSATMRMFVIADTTIEGAQCLAMRTVDNGGPVGYEKSFTARVSATDAWGFAIAGYVDGTAAIGDELRIGFSAGASDLAYANTAFSLNFARSTTAGKVRLDVYEQGGVIWGDDVATLGQKFMIRVSLPPGENFTVAVDDDMDGEGWVGVRSGSIVTGKGAISRVQVIAEGGTTGDDLLKVDAIRIVQYGDYKKVIFGDQPQRMAKLTAATGGTVATNGVVTLTADVYDEVTGVVVDSGRTETMHVSELDPAIAAGRIDAALQKIVNLYDKEQRVAEVNTSGHEVLL